MTVNKYYMDKKPEQLPFKITERGSLGLLALGDIGLRAWRAVRKEAQLKRNNEKKE